MPDKTVSLASSIASKLAAAWAWCVTIASTLLGLPVEKWVAVMALVGGIFYACTSYNNWRKSRIDRKVAEMELAQRECEMYNGQPLP